MFKSDLDRLYREEQVKDYLRESLPPGVEHLPRPRRYKRVGLSAMLVFLFVLFRVGLFLVAGPH